MAKSNLIETRTASLGELFSNGRKYRVPLYQRDYSWAEENWEELWEDIEYARDTNDRHYMGTVVLQRSSDKIFEVIDGQQRFATLSALILAVIAKLDALAANNVEPEANKNRSQLLSERFVRSRDAVSLNFNSRLTLNRATNGFYQSYLIQLLSPPAPTKLAEAERALYNAFRYFQRTLDDRYGADVSGEALAKLVENDIADRLLFIEVLVDDDLRAYTLFETLNARGLELSVTDLLKNYLFSLAGDSDTDLDLAQEKWRRIVNRTGLKEFPAVLRHFWNSSNPYVREQYLFKTVRKTVRDKADAFQLLDALEQVSILYSALKDPEDDLWENDQTLRERVQELCLFRVSQCNPLIFAAYARADRDQFKRILKICTVLSFRYTIIARLNPQPLERAYNLAAIAVTEGTATTAQAVAAILKNVLVDDETFEQTFAAHTTRTNRNDLTRYILLKLEGLLSGEQEGLRNPAATIEHILPENPSADWDEMFPPEIRENFVYRLGNLTLLESGKNRLLGNVSFAAKRAEYATSRFAMTQRIETEIWNSAAVSARQRDMARWAVGVWKIDY